MGWVCSWDVNYITRNCVIYTDQPVLLGQSIQEVRMDWVCRWDGGEAMSDTKLTVNFVQPAVASPFEIGVKFVFLSYSAVLKELSTRWTGRQTGVRTEKPGRGNFETAVGSQAGCQRGANDQQRPLRQCTLSYYVMTSRAYIKRCPFAVPRQWVACNPGIDPQKEAVQQAVGKSSSRDKHSLMSSTEPRPAFGSPRILFGGYWGSFHRG